MDATNGELVALVVATGFADRLVLLDERFAGEPTLMGVPCVTADVGDRHPSGCCRRGGA